MLKLHDEYKDSIELEQPPSGGCVLKPDEIEVQREVVSAAFRRLCVETAFSVDKNIGYMPAAFRRLCVETEYVFKSVLIDCQPPSGGCVLKPCFALYRQFC